jgi:nitrogen PTS system EIIA component
MTLADFTSATLILPSLRGREAAAILQELSQVLHQEKRVPVLLPFYHAVLNREFLASTALEPGLAVPHARLAGLPGLSFAFGRSLQPVSWCARTGQAVRLVFLMAVPATDATQYLQVISGLARLAREPAWVERLQAAPDVPQILEVLAQVLLRRTSQRPSSEQPLKHSLIPPS